MSTRHTVRSSSGYSMCFVTDGFILKLNSESGGGGGGGGEKETETHKIL